jgi:uncharacterized protein
MRSTKSGAIYSGGHNHTIERAEAQRWFRAAAELGHGQAQLMLARYLVSGVAGEKRPAEARTWLERAVAQGVPEAEADLAEMGSLADQPPPPSPSVLLCARSA